MNSQSMITIAAPLAYDKVAVVRSQIETQLGNPALASFRQAVEAEAKPILHFASLHALASSDGKQGHLVLELSADGSESFVMQELARRAGTLLEPIFEHASDWRAGQALAEYWSRHTVKVGFGLFDIPGLPFCGTPRQDVAAIKAEDALAREIACLLAEQDIAMPPLGKIGHVRDRLGQSAQWAWALSSPPSPIPAPKSQSSAAATAVALAPSFAITFLWPLLILFLPLCIWFAWPEAWTHWPHLSALGWQEGLLFLKQIVGFLTAVSGLELLLVASALSVTYLAFRRQEARDFLSTHSPDSDELKAMVAHENAVGFVQNHMLSQTVMKPGLIRRLTIRLAFWTVANVTARNPRVGHLGDIGTIHFARWVSLPGTSDLLFLSNYGGSWESYLEDFITKAHQGLTAIWSNTVGFPRSSNLFQDGATDGERFKRYARQSMTYTPFWYSAYPTLTTDNIRANQLIRRGLAAAMTESEAVEWLTYFGSAPRPVSKLETTQIQSLIFGGLGFKPDGRLLLVKLGDDVGRNKEWLRGLLPMIVFNDGRYATQSALVSLALGPDGFTRLGMDEATLASFPAAFLQGMHGAGRERILGDLGANGRCNWVWGRDGDHAALLVYGNQPGEGEPRPIDALSDKIAALTGEAGGEITHSVELTPVASKLTDRKEPFGFVDGVSQPSMRGTYRGLRNDDPIHLVEPGEFVLGYPDNRGHVPPGPMMDARHDPMLRLPVAGTAQGFAESVVESPRLAGYNGSFLVIRQLEQHVDQFKAYCREQGGKLVGAFPDLPLLPGEGAMSEFVAAKLIGRWRDGSSLIRNPYVSASTLKALTGRDRSLSASRPASKPSSPMASPIDPADARAAPPDQSSSMPEIHPDNDFLFGTEDPQGIRCPFGAHVRRANPRESLSPGSQEQIDITNRHRIIRVGRGYLGDDKTTKGLMFMCLNGDIERQFEFIQQTWMGSTKFQGLTSETDPIAGRCLPGSDGFTIPTRRGPVVLNALPQFVTMRGGGYFFLPGRQLLLFLADA